MCFLFIQTIYIYNRKNIEIDMSAKKPIKLTESKLKEIIAESIKEALNEISYSTVKSAYNKMQAKGQPKRAEKLSRTFSDIYNDDDVQYDVANDKLTLQKDATPYNQHQDRRHAFYMGNDRGYERDTVKWGGGANLPDDTDNHHITTSPAKARKYANAIKNYNPNTKLTRDDFRK